MARARDSQSGALFELSGQVSKGATWAEDIWFTEDGAAFLLTGLEFRLQLRNCRSDVVELLLNTGDELSLVEDTGSGVVRILRITVAPGAMTNLRGDYFADLSSKDAADTIKHWAHGIISFIDDPVLW